MNQQCVCRWFDTVRLTRISAAYHIGQYLITPQHFRVISEWIVKMIAGYMFVLQQLAVATLYKTWMDILSLSYRFVTLFMNNGYFHIKNGYFPFASQVPLPFIQWTSKHRIARYTALNWWHHGAPDYVNRICAFADSDFIPNLVASLHLQVSRHLTTVKFMTEK